MFKFYTGFITDPKKKAWDTNLENSTQMFISGKLGFYFAPAEKEAEIRTQAPNINFQVAGVPQLPGGQVAWASFWGMGVSAKSKFPKEAWQLVKFLSSREVQKDEAGPYYKFWYLASNTQDVGINDEMIKVFSDGIIATLAGTDLNSVLQTVDKGVKQVLDKYQ